MDSITLSVYEEFAHRSSRHVGAIFCWEGDELWLICVVCDIFHITTIVVFRFSGCGFLFGFLW